MKSISNLSLFILVAFATQKATGDDCLRNLLPYGEQARDKPVEENVSLALNGSYYFHGEMIEVIFISSNELGVLIFDQILHENTIIPDNITKDEYPYIAVFENENEIYISYREMSPTGYECAHALLSDYIDNFDPTYMLQVTWYKDELNIVQVVLAATALNETYAVLLFNSTDGTLDQSNIGFNAGDGEQFFNILPDLNSGSICRNRVCVYRVDQANIAVPPGLFCPTLTDPENGFVAVTGHGVQSIATYHCYPGYILHERKTRSCHLTSNHTLCWSNNAPICREPLKLMFVSNTPFVHGGFFMANFTLNRENVRDITCTLYYRRRWHSPRFTRYSIPMNKNCHITGSSGYCMKYGEKRIFNKYTLRITAKEGCEKAVLNGQFRIPKYNNNYCTVHLINGMTNNSFSKTRENVVKFVAFGDAESVQCKINKDT